MKLGTKESCECEACIDACTHKPGWFLPGEIEKVAEFLDLSLKELFDQYLGIDWYSAEKGDTHRKPLWVIAPAQNNMEPGGQYPVAPQGRCIFLTEDNKCRIHEVKPYQCRVMIHNNPDMKPEGAYSKLNKATALKWKEHKPQIVELLGKEPEEPGMLEMLFGTLDILKYNMDNQ